MQPTGWFQIAWSLDLKAGEIKPLNYFGSELVLFRGLDEAVYALDANCQHLGANLAYGGCVVDDGIQCPFHGWVWSGAGRNVRIPYEARPNRGRRIRSWPVTEINECIFVWHDVAGRAPLWDLPDWRSVLSDNVVSQRYRTLGAEERELFACIKVHPQIVAENAVDPHHFQFVHRTPISPVVLAETTDDTTWHAKVGFGNCWRDGADRPGDTRNAIEIYWSGIGFSHNGECTADGVGVIAINATPVDESRSDIFASYWVSESDDYTSRLARPRLHCPTTSTSGSTRGTWTRRRWHPQNTAASPSCVHGRRASTPHRLRRTAPTGRRLAAEVFQRPFDELEHHAVG